MAHHLLRLLSLLLLSSSVVAAEPISGQFEEGECVACHQPRNPALVEGWRASRHRQNGQPVACTACHGSSHETVAVQARRDAACSQCHGGGKGAVAHSYSSSKHGVINRIEARATDWGQPLQAGNYRAPGCAYCHASGGEHRMENRVVQPAASDAAQPQPQPRREMGWVCQHCHAPRFVAEQQANGVQMAGLGEMKRREAKQLVEQARKMYPSAQLILIEQLYHEMETETLKALRLGIGHQSPDYQWWHGHPALDGKLLRIKGELTRLQRGQAD
jgi:hypothetical protein